MHARRLAQCLTLAAVALAGCANPAPWRRHADYNVGEASKQILARVTVSIDNVPLNDCSVCFAPRQKLRVNCARIDDSGIVYQPIERNMAWLKEVECRREDKSVVRHVFEFPYYAAETEEVDVVHYLGHIDIIFLGDRPPLVHITENVAGLRARMRDHGRDVHKLPILSSVLKLQDNIWDQQRRVRD